MGAASMMGGNACPSVTVLRPIPVFDELVCRPRPDMAALARGDVGGMASDTGRPLCIRVQPPGMTSRTAF